MSMSMKRHGMFLTGLAIVLFMSVLALLAPWIAPFDPAALNLDQILMPPSAEHLLGTDELGRDVLSRLLYGARVSLWGGLRGRGHIHGHRHSAGAGFRLFRRMDGRTHHARRGRDALLSLVLSHSRRHCLSGTESHQHHGGHRTHVVDGRGPSCESRNPFPQGTRLHSRLKAGRSFHDTSAFRAHSAQRSRPGARVGHARSGRGHSADILSSAFSDSAFSLRNASWGNMLMDGKNTLEIAPWLSSYPGLAILITVLGLQPSRPKPAGHA